MKLEFMDSYNSILMLLLLILSLHRKAVFFIYFNLYIAWKLLPNSIAR